MSAGRNSVEPRQMKNRRKEHDDRQRAGHVGRQRRRGTGYDRLNPGQHCEAPIRCVDLLFSFCRPQVKNFLRTKVNKMSFMWLTY